MKKVQTMREVYEVAAMAQGDFSFVFVSEPYTCYKKGRYCTAPDAWLS